MLKAMLVSMIGGMLSGRSFRNGWIALILVVGLVVAEDGYMRIHQHHGLRDCAVALGVLDVTGTSSVLVAALLSV